MTQTSVTQENITEALQSVQFVVGMDGRRTGVLMGFPTWETVLAWIEEMEDRAIIRAALPRLRLGPEKAHALRWEEDDSRCDAP